MPNYSTNLISWGSTGSAYPNGYQYESGKNPVDAWDNYFAYNVVKDIDHLISVTNEDLLAVDGSNDMDAALNMNSQPINSVSRIRPQAGDSFHIETADGGDIIIRDVANGEDLGRWAEGVGIKLEDGDIDLNNRNVIDSTGTNNTVEITAGNALSGGGATPLGGSTTLNVSESSINHNSLGGITSDAHHARYTDAEAQAAVGGAHVSESDSQAIGSPVHSNFNRSFNNTYSDAAMTFGFGNNSFSNGSPVSGTMYAGFSGWETSGGNITGVEFYLVNQTGETVELNWEVFGLEA